MSNSTAILCISGLNRRHEWRHTFQHDVIHYIYTGRSQLSSFIVLFSMAKYEDETV